MPNSPRGRPADPEKQQLQKSLILEATQFLLMEKSYRLVTVRDIAERAGVNSAMIRYYFEHKEGLFIALLDQMSDVHLSRMQQFLNAPDPLKAVIKGLINMLSENSSFARMIHDEVLKDDSPFRDAFIERFPKRMAHMLSGLIQQSLHIDDQLRAKYLAFNLISMIILPFIGEPVRKLAWQISDEELADPAWAEHIYSLFINGCNQEQSK
ncbi:MAG: AcrR family transcriptional regulator [Paraglaciecola sp.]|jgi:AcrR family transcriptional regulator